MNISFLKEENHILAFHPHTGYIYIYMYVRIK